MVFVDLACSLVNFHELLCAEWIGNVSGRGQWFILYLQTDIGVLRFSLSYLEITMLNFVFFLIEIESSSAISKLNKRG